MHKSASFASTSLLVLVALAGCGGTGTDIDAGNDANFHSGDALLTNTDAAVRVDAGPPSDTGPMPDAGTTVVAGGEVSGAWCGSIVVMANVTVPVGATLMLCPGAAVHFADGVRMTVSGTLVMPGSAVLPITLDASTMWNGLSITGTVEGAFVRITHASQAIAGLAGSTITLNDSRITDSSATLSLANGGTLDRTTILGGSTVSITGGLLRMTDSVIDLGHATVSPDCTDWTAGGAVLDHVRFTGCHCPIHINHASLEFTITNSILDGATNPVMIADSTATFTNNDFIGTSSLVLDIGAGRSGIMCNLAGNYWDGPMGHVAQVGTTNHSQFTGEDMVLSARVPGAGPR